MESLPIELLEHIFTLACTDGGYTGSSLSLVSKDVREASRSARFHSVSLMEASHCQMTEFSSCFRAERRRARAQGITLRVRHLCISGWTSQPWEQGFRRKREEHIPLRSGLSRMSSAPCRWMDARGICMDDPYRLGAGLDERKAFDDAVSAILTAVSHDLHTLSVCHGWAMGHFQMPAVEGVTFPSLEELTLVGMQWNLLTNGGMSFGPPTATLPRLSRLHIFDVVASGCHVNLARWSSCAPHLTHLRLTNMVGNFQQVREILESESTNRLFPSLQQLILYCDRSDSNELLRDRFRDLVSSTTRPHVLFPQRAYVRLTGHTTEAKGHWLDRMAGGPGWWNSAHLPVQSSERRT